MMKSEVVGVIKWIGGLLALIFLLSCFVEFMPEMMRFSEMIGDYISNWYRSIPHFFQTYLRLLSGILVIVIAGLLFLVFEHIIRAFKSL